MAEILVKAVDHVHPDPERDRRGSYKRGMPVVVMPDGHAWGSEERLPKFIVLRIPGISVDRVRKYMEPDIDLDDATRTFRRRLWIIRWENLPQRARNLIRDNGGLTIAAGGYTGPADYSWTQIKVFWRNQRTGQDEAEEL